MSRLRRLSANSEYTSFFFIIVALNYDIELLNAHYLFSVIVLKMCNFRHDINSEQLNHLHSYAHPLIIFSCAFQIILARPWPFPLKTMRTVADRFLKCPCKAPRVNVNPIKLWWNYIAANCIDELNLSFWNDIVSFVTANRVKWVIYSAMCSLF